MTIDDAVAQAVQHYRTRRPEERPIPLAHWMRLAQGDLSWTVVQRLFAEHPSGIVDAVKAHTARRLELLKAAAIAADTPGDHRDVAAKFDVTLDRVTRLKRTLLGDDSPDRRVKHNWRALWRKARDHFPAGKWIKSGDIKTFLGLPYTNQAWYRHIQSDDLPAWLKVKTQTRANGQVSRLFMFPAPGGSR